jgi:co-chaperonin GroES (HSP10)
MKPLEAFIVTMKKKMNDTITIAGGIELYVDTKYDEFKHRVNEAEVVAVPYKFETGVSPGDTLYFHHHVVINSGQPLTGEEDSYIVNYSETALNNQAIAYRKKGTDTVVPLGGWVVLEPVVEEKKKLSEIIEVIEFKEEDVKKGKVTFYADYFDEIGINIGDVVAFNPKFGYKFKIDEKDYLRIRLIDLLYVETN